MSIVDNQTRRQCVEMLDEMIESKSILPEQLSGWPVSSPDWNVMSVKKILTYIYRQNVVNYREPQNTSLPPADIELLQRLKLLLMSDDSLDVKYRINAMISIPALIAGFAVFFIVFFLLVFYYPVWAGVCITVWGIGVGILADNMRTKPLITEMVESDHWPFRCGIEYQAACEEFPNVVSEEFSIPAKMGLSEDNPVTPNEFLTRLFRANIRLRLQGRPRRTLGKINPYKDPAVEDVPAVLDIADNYLDEQQYSAMLERCKQFLTNYNHYHHERSVLQKSVHSLMLHVIIILSVGLAAFGLYLMFENFSFSSYTAFKTAVLGSLTVVGFLVIGVAPAYIFEKWFSRHCLIGYVKDSHWPFIPGQEK